MPWSMQLACHWAKLRPMRLLLLALALAACQPTGNALTGSDAGACQKFGEQCEYSPGKLGTCVQKTNCTPEQSCLVCQSQH